MKKIACFHYNVLWTIQVFGGWRRNRNVL